MSRDHRQDESVSPPLGPLFAPREQALSGRTDPQTSGDAAARMVESGALGGHQRWALAVVRRHAGCTVKEMAEAQSSYDEHDTERVRQQLGRRLNELEKAGLIRRDGVRDGCSIWYPTKEG